MAHWSAATAAGTLQGGLRAPGSTTLRRSAIHVQLRQYSRRSSPGLQNPIDWKKEGRGRCPHGGQKGRRESKKELRAAASTVSVAAAPVAVCQFKTNFMFVPPTRISSTLFLPSA